MELLGVIGWPILDRIRLGPLAISPHGLFIAVGYLLGTMWFLRLGARRGIKEEEGGTIAMWALVGAIVGARLFFVLAHLDEFDGITDMLALWRGGFTLIGGITGATFLGWLAARRYGIRFGQGTDAVAPGLAFGIMVGRVGDLIIGDHLGKPTDFFLGWTYGGGTLPGPWQQTGPGEWTASLPGDRFQVLTEQGARLFDGSGGDPTLIQQGAGVHQTALYDLLIAGALFLFLWWLARSPRREGVIAASFGLWYGAGRILTDFLRIDKTWVIGLTGSQWASVAVVAVSLGTLIWFALRPKPPEPEPAPVVLPEAPTTDFRPPPEPGGP